MTAFDPDLRRRAAGAAAAVALQALLGWALLSGLSVDIAPRVAAALTVFDVAPPVAPPPPPVPVRHAAHRRPAAAAPPHARATPTEVVAPIPEIPLPPPPAIVAAPLPALGADASAGAAAAGPGTGAGGAGSGRGAGTGGDGSGAGGTPSRWLRGEITGRDYPREAKAAGLEGDLVTRYLIDSHGRIAKCWIMKSSGSDLLDATTCRIAIARFRFAPARDAGGHPVADTVYQDHGWHITSDDAPDDPG
jgi:protein TonB